MRFFNDFKEFISRGNVVDLAVGVIIGASFGAITTSLVKDIVMPPIGLLLAGINFSKLKYVLKGGFTDAAGKVHPAVSINYGIFVQTVMNFLIIAFVVFLVISAVHKLRKKQQAKPPDTPTHEETLLTDIRDVLREMNSKEGIKG